MHECFKILYEQQFDPPLLSATPYFKFKFFICGGKIYPEKASYTEIF